MEAAIFDLDGTIVDSMWLWSSLADRFLLSMGIEPPAGGFFRRFRKMTLDESCQYMQENFDIGRDASEIKRGIEELIAVHYREKFKPKPHVLEILEEFRDRQIRMVLATASYESMANIVLERYSIGDYFEFVQTVDNTGLKKSGPEFFQLIIDRLDIEPESIWAFEDALHCIESAKRCNLNIVAIEDESASADRERIKEIADIYIEDFSQLDIDELFEYE